MYSEEIIFNLLAKEREKVFSVQSIKDEYELNFSRIQIRRSLARLHKKKLIYRSKTQLNEGYVFSISGNAVNEVYKKHLLPYDFDDKEKLIKKIIKASYNKSSNKVRIKIPKNNDFVKRYGLNYFYNERIQEQLAIMVSFIMGDGHLKKDLREIQLFFRYKTDAQLFKNHFLKHFPKEKVIVRKSSFCFVCSICKKEVCELFYYLGAPKGNKLTQEFNIPKWILSGPRYIKKAYLSTIIGNEGSKPQDNRWRIQFVLSKEKKYIENLLDLLNEIKGLLKEFNITTSHIQLRTQPGRNYYGRFYIKGKDNIRKFYNTFEFLYASEKQEVLESLIKNDSLKCNNAMIS